MWIISAEAESLTNSKKNKINDVINGGIMHNQVLLTYYIKYLKDIRGLSESSIGHYTQALRKISLYLVEKEKIQESIYEIQDVGELEIIRTYLYNSPEFVDFDKRGHQMYSAGLNNYYKFASGEGFTNIKNKIEILDTEVEIPDVIIRTSTQRKRSSIIKIQAIKSAGYQCEFDESHSTFIAKSSGQPYMEGHHALSMKYQGEFNYSLDVYANVICLCPICHRLLHYGVEEQKKIVVNKIYNDRAGRLANSGLKIGKDDFYKLVI